MGDLDSCLRPQIMNKQELLNLYSLASSSSKGCKKGGCVYLNDGGILYSPSLEGDARYPYTEDGLSLWAYGSGYITSNESNFFIFPSTLEGKEPYLAFYGGIKKDDGSYSFFSLSGVADTCFGMKEEKYCLYYPSHVIYLRRVENSYFALVAFIASDKSLRFSLYGYSEDREILLSSYINPLLMHGNYESEETKWFRKSELFPSYCLISSVEDISRTEHLDHYCLLRNAHNGKKEETSSRMLYVGDKNRSISLSSSLEKGCFPYEKKVTTFIDSAIYGDIIEGEKELYSHYVLSLSSTPIEVTPFNKEDNEIERKKLEEKSKEFCLNPSKLSIAMKGIEKEEEHNRFLLSVTRQVDYCSKCKNSSLSLLGVRDLSQMLEASLLWDKANARKRIIELLSFSTLEGRLPRQVSFPKEGNECLLDNREFIDQGQWIITLVHRYLSYTGDFSLLEEECSYCELHGMNKGTILPHKETVFRHLERIIGFLRGNIDMDTHCLKTLYGDWNDAVDGLGKSEDPSKEFGNGVSTMATFHLYENLHEWQEILAYLGKEDSSIDEDLALIEKGIQEYLIQEKEGHYRIIHGFGENRSFYVGSYNDVDNKDRLSATSNAFYAISGFAKKYPYVKEDAIKAFDELSGPYGIKTFSEPFAKENASKVGRIVNLPFGTAENAATYVHAGLFSVRALLKLKEGGRAYKELEKLLPITHNKISVTPFVMNNSYGYNPSLGIDGESMNDWYTGSSNTLLKTFYEDIFGLKVSLKGLLTIDPTHDFPVEEVKVDVTLRGTRCHLIYRHNNKHSIYLNDELVEKIEVLLSKYKELTIIVND